MLPRASNALRAGALLALAASAFGQASLPFPLDVVARDAESRELVLHPRPAELDALRAHRRLRFADVELPGGRLVDLELRRIDLERMRFGVRVDDSPWPTWSQDLSLSVWRGAVEGEPGSDVVLSFSRVGSRGWVRSTGRTFHLIAEPGADSDWSASVSRLTTEDELLARGQSLGDFCRYDEVQDVPLIRAEESSGYQGGAPLDTLLIELAIETDYQLFQQFGDVNAEAAYVGALLAAVSDKYDEEIDVVLGYPYVQFYTNPNDPWNPQDNGGSASALLSAFQSAWGGGNIPAGADLGHFLSGAGLGGGVAFLGGLCSTGRFAVSGNINGGLQFPVQQQSGNWDFMVVAHETGHNFNAPHTHEFCPAPLDSCAPSGYWGPCQSSTNCAGGGTIMSYCHLCSGGTNNIQLGFHPLNRIRMRTRAEFGNCAEVLCEAPEVFCSPKVNSFFCTPFMTYVGDPSVTDTGPFRIIGNDIMPNDFGLLVYGTNGRGSLPFHNATLCVKAPLTRVLPPKSSGAPGTGFCPGELRFNFNNRIQSGIDPQLSAGAQVATQWLYRDPGVDAFNDGLTDGLAFQICP